LSVEKRNDKGKHFYDSMGFKVVGEGQDKVGNEVIDEYHMEKELTTYP
jgi:ribosomal protein S18 acetylase RimI-like enzyme